MRQHQLLLWSVESYYAAAVVFEKFPVFFFFLFINIAAEKIDYYVHLAVLLGLEPHLSNHQFGENSGFVSQEDNSI